MNLAGWLLASGIPLGLLLTALAGRLIGDLGASVQDWRLWVLTPLALAITVLAASFVRARRVLALDPAVMQRGEC